MFWLTFRLPNGDIVLAFMSLPPAIREFYMVFWRKATADNSADVLTKFLNGKTGAQVAGAMHTAAGRLDTVRGDDYLNPTEGDARYVLEVVAASCDVNPTAVFAVFP